MSEQSPKTIAQRLGPVQAGLRRDLEVTRHVFRGQPYYVVRDPLTFQTHQFSQPDYQILVALHDSLPLAEVFQNLVREGRLAAEREEEFYQFVLKLHQLSYLALPIADGKLLYDRYAVRERAARWRQISGFLFLRLPLVNPDAFLSRTVNWARPLFTPAAFVLWLVMMALAGAILARQWDHFTDPLHSLLAGNSLPALWLSLIGLKVIHELGHAYACKVWGGRVPEMGAYLIVFTPCAYMDASSAWGFSSLRQRVIVSLAGMYFESIVAFVALLVWTWTQNPVLSSWAHHVVVLATVVTIGFNINPLMRYDGYFVLSDLTGIPNLRQRSVEQVQNVLKRWLLGIPTSGHAAGSGTRLFLLGFGIASIIYKVILVMAICTMIAWRFPMVGIALAAFFLAGVLITAARRLVTYLWYAAETQPVRWRAATLCVLLLLGAPLALATVPAPARVIVPGLVQSLEDKTIHAPVDGVLASPRLEPGAEVRAGQVICELTNVDLDAQLAVAQAQSRVKQMQFNLALALDAQAATAARLRYDHAQDALDHIRHEHAQLQVAAPCAGQLIQLVDQRDTGRFVRRGDTLATIATGPATVRCVMTGDQISDTRPRVGEPVRVRVMLRGVREFQGVVEDVAVKASRHVFSAALTQHGGGSIAVEPGSLAARQPLFEVVVRLDRAEPLRFCHDAQAMVSFPGQQRSWGAYGYHRFRQFLNRLRVDSGRSAKSEV